jgi:7-carboxy-7-deazaguanine synthase
MTAPPPQGVTMGTVTTAPPTAVSKQVLRLVTGGIFGPTFQGEGVHQGRWTCFVRLHRCNLHCGLAEGGIIRPGGCDTAESWNATQFPFEKWAYEATVDQVLAELGGRMRPRMQRGGPGAVVVTGGEPLMQARQLAHLLRACRRRGWQTEIETNGTLPPTRLGGPDWWPDQFNVSPKLEGGINQGAEPESKRIRLEAIEAFLASGRAVWKLVVADLHDLAEVGWLIERLEHDHNLTLPAKDVWIMPEGTTPERIIAGLRELADPVLERGWNLTSRLHILIWGDQRGR